MLGFSLLKHTFQFVEIQYQTGKPVITQFAKRSTPIPFTQENLLVGASKNQFRQIIEEAINYYNLSGPITLTLDSRFAFVRKLLVDVAATEDQIEKQINWESRQFLPKDSLSEYQFIYERLPAGYYNNSDALITILYRKLVIDSIKDLFAGTPLSLQFFELDLLSALYGINRLYGIRDQSFTVLADIRRDVLKLIFARKGEFFDYHKLSLNEDNEESEAEVYTSEESLAKLINKEIRRKLLDYRLESEKKSIDSLFLFGEKASNELCQYFDDGPVKDKFLVEPFEKMDKDESILNSSESLPLSSEYTVCVGTALRSVF